MQEYFGDLNMKICLIYLDNLIIFGSYFKHRLKELAQEKCPALDLRLHFLVIKRVSGAGVETVP